MTYYTDTTARGHGIAHRTSNLIADVAGKIRTRRMYRETFNGLSALTTRELTDLGLDRSDLRRVSWEAANAAR